MDMDFLRKSRSWYASLVAVMVTSIIVVGCSSGANSNLGATPGGAQDDALANEKIANGLIPRPEDVTVEGVLAAHDFPLDSVPCTRELCINSAYAVAPTLDVQRSAVFLQLGFDTGMDAASFVRAPLNLSVVVDRSGSMAGDKILAVRTALSRLLNQLDESDRLSIVLFDDRVETLLASTPVSDRESIRALLPKIVERGSTNLSAGLRAGYEQVEKHGGIAGVSDRVMVFTDAIANTGDTDTTSFVSLATDNAEKDIGLTLFGVGTDLNQSLVLAISKLKGNNYLYLSDAARITEVFDVDFDYLVTPLAYNLHFKLTPAANYAISQAYGAADSTVGLSTVELTVPTVFLSRGHGAIVVRLEPRTSWPRENAPIANLSLVYSSATSGESIEQQGTTAYAGSEALSDTTSYYSQRAVRRTVAFVNATIGEKRACTQYYGGSKSAAVATLDDAIALVDRESAALDDLDLAEQAAILLQLRGNMEAYVEYDRGSEPEYDGAYMMCEFARPRSDSARLTGLFLLAVGLLLLRNRRQ